jgi:hypothetical protein
MIVPNKMFELVSMQVEAISDGTVLQHAH